MAGLEPPLSEKHDIDIGFGMKFPAAISTQGQGGTSQLPFSRGMGVSRVRQGIQVLNGGIHEIGPFLDHLTAAVAQSMKLMNSPLLLTVKGTEGL
jgi:hypothetical protein